MKRTKHHDEGSLDLLLDTITNTFGSILFITILVALLLRFSGHVSSRKVEVSKADQARAQARLAELSAEVNRLKATLDFIPQSDSEVVRIERSIAAAAQELAAVFQEDAAAATEISDDQDYIVSVHQRLASLSQELERLRPLADESAQQRAKAEETAANLAALASELDRPIDPERIEQTATLPELTSTSKKQIGLFMRYGRVYVMHQWSPAGMRLGPNTDHFVISTRPDGNQSAKARPDAGCLADQATIKSALREILRGFPPDNWVVGLVVNEDSFPQFQTVKSTLVALGYQYEPFPIEVGNGAWDMGGSARGQ